MIKINSTENFRLSENLLWHQEKFWFIDIEIMRLYCFDPKSMVLKHWQFTETIGFFAFCTDDNVIVGLNSGIYHYNIENQLLTFICHPIRAEEMPSTTRYNDAKVSPDGDLWFASMDQSNPRSPVAKLFCLLRSGKVVVVFEQLRVGNGIAFDAIHDRVFFSETDNAGPRIYSAQYSSARATILEGKQPQFSVFAESDNATGRPDGATVDRDGNYWSAGVSAGVINVYSPQGNIIRRIKTPISSPTCPCFGGEHLNQLTITSLSRSSDEQCDDGQLFYDDINTAYIGQANHPSPWPIDSTSPN